MTVLIISNTHQLPALIRNTLAASSASPASCQFLSIPNVEHTPDSEVLSARFLFFVFEEGNESELHQLKLLRERTQHPIIAVGDVENHFLLLEAIHSGADDFIDAAGNVQAQVTRAYLRKRRSSPSENHGKIFTVTSASGGTGVSVIASNLAAVLAQRTKRCNLLDFQLPQGDQASLFHIQPRHTLSDVCLNISNLDTSLLEGALHPHASGVHLLGATGSTYHFDRQDEAHLIKIAQCIKKVSELTVIDLCTKALQDPFPLMGLSETVFIVTRPDFTSMANTSVFLEQLLGSGFPIDRIQLIINRDGMPGSIPKSTIRDGLKHPVSCVIPDDPLTVNRSVNCGNPAVLDQPESSFSKGLQCLANRICPEPAPTMSKSHRQRFLGMLGLPFKTTNVSESLQISLIH